MCIGKDMVWFLYAIVLFLHGVHIFQKKWMGHHYNSDWIFKDFIMIGQIQIVKAKGAFKPFKQYGYHPYSSKDDAIGFILSQMPLNLTKIAWKDAYIYHIS